MELFVVFFLPVSRSRSILLHGFLSLFQMFFQQFFVLLFFVVLIDFSELTGGQDTLGSVHRAQLNQNLCQ